MALTPTVFLFGRKAPPKIVEPVYDDNGILKSAFTALKFDCAIDETHSIKNVVTMFPIEEGLDITDHIRQEPDRLKITGFVTNSPVEYLAFAQLDGANRVQAAYNTLMRLSGRKNTKLMSDIPSMQAPVLIDIFTTLRVWLNMVIESFEVPRTAETGDAIQFSMDLVSIRKVAVNLATVNYSDTSRSGGAGGNDDALTDKTDTGSKPTQKTAPRTDSFLKTASTGGLSKAVTSMKDALLSGIGQ
jgi:hypothetical protein